MQNCLHQTESVNYFLSIIDVHVDDTCKDGSLARKRHGQGIFMRTFTHRVWVDVAILLYVAAVMMKYPLPRNTDHRQSLTYMLH